MEEGALQSQITFQGISKLQCPCDVSVSRSRQPVFTDEAGRDSAVALPAGEIAFRR
jgi:hypothetical protein